MLFEPLPYQTKILLKYNAKIRSSAGTVKQVLSSLSFSPGKILIHGNKYRCKLAL